MKPAKAKIYRYLQAARANSMRVIDPLDLSGGMPNVYVNEYWSSNPNGLKTNPEPYKLWYTTQSNLCTFGDDLFYESIKKNPYDGGLDSPSATGTQQYFSGSEANGERIHVPNLASLEIVEVEA